MRLENAGTTYFKIVTVIYISMKTYMIETCGNWAILPLTLSFYHHHHDYGSMLTLSSDESDIH